MQEENWSTRRKNCENKYGLETKCTYSPNYTRDRTQAPWCTAQGKRRYATGFSVCFITITPYDLYKISHWKHSSALWEIHHVIFSNAYSTQVYTLMMLPYKGADTFTKGVPQDYNGSKKADFEQYCCLACARVSVIPHDPRFNTCFRVLCTLMLKTI